MKIRTRLLLLFGGLLAMFGAAGGLLQLAQRREIQAIRTGILAERTDLLERMLQLRGQTLYEFVRDYSLWDEMVRFVREGDRNWAAINLDASLANFDVQAVWVLGPDGAGRYTATAPAHPGLADVMPREPAFLERLRAESELHFFARSAEGLVELRTSPILPSDDVQRRQTPRGWFVVARLWDADNLASLADSLQSRIVLDAAPGATPDDAVHFEHPVRDWHGNHLATLQLVYESRTLSALLEGSDADTLLLYAFGAVNLLAVVLGVTLWLIRPLRRLAESLNSGRREPLAPLLARTDEFGELSRRLAHSFVQRDALQESESRLLQSIDVRARLARDLHDGVIQSIYAAGLGLESLPALRATDPAAADRRLASCRQMLNETLWQIRNFIGALEPESDRRQTTSQSITTLATSMQALQSTPIDVDIDQAVAANIGAAQELHLLQILRELLSNALRHSAARRIRVSLQTGPDDKALLVVADDGIGFDPAQPHDGGRGLRNLAVRVTEIRGELDVQSVPGNGTRIAVRFRAA